MQMRTPTWLSSLLLAGCIVPATSPPPQYQQTQPAQQPAPADEPPQEPYQPPPAAQPTYERPPTQQAQYSPPPAQYSPPPAQYSPPPAPDDLPASYGDPAYTDLNVELTGSDVPSVDVFYDQLAPYGTWYDDPSYGWVFTPSDPSYVPYTNGHWTNTEYGFTWVGNEPFSWATDHYGRWVWANRWAWRPDTTWGPSWVQWRQGDGYVGWAPVGYADDAYFPEEHWRFVPATYLLAPDAPRYIIRGNTRSYVGSTFAVRHYGRDRRNHTWVIGPDQAWLQRNRVEARRERVDPARIGRFDDARRRDAEVRARDRQREWDDRRRRDEQVRRELDARQRRQDDDRRRLADEHRQLDEQRRRRDQEQRQLADQQRRIDEQHQRAASDNERRRLEAERKRLDDQQRRLGEEQRRRDDEQRRKREDEQHRVEADRRRQGEQLERQRAEDQRRFAEEQRRQQDDQRKAADDRRKADDANRQRGAGDHRKPDEPKRDDKRKDDDKKP